MDNIVNKIKDDGFAVMENFFSDSEAALIKNEIINCFEPAKEGCYAITENGVTSNGPDGEFPQGKNIRIMQTSYNQIPNVCSIIFENYHVNKIISDYYSDNCNRFLQVFASWENKMVEDDDLARYSWLHSDPYASLKFAFFPFGASKKNGAPRVVPKSRSEGETIRKQFMSRGPKGIQGGVAHRMIDFKEQCPDLITRSEDEAISVEVSPNDMLILDTDTYHAGGNILEPHQERIAVYIHNRP